MIEKTLEFKDEFVTCTTCDCNYNKDDYPIFCQEFLTPMNPRNIYENMDRASRCKYCPLE